MTENTPCWEAVLIGLSTWPWVVSSHALKDQNAAKDQRRQMPLQITTAFCLASSFWGLWPHKFLLLWPSEFHPLCCCLDAACGQLSPPQPFVFRSHSPAFYNKVTSCFAFSVVLLFEEEWCIWPYPLMSRSGGPYNCFLPSLPHCFLLAASCFSF